MTLSNPLDNDLCEEVIEDYKNDEPSPVRYEISTYGADYDVEGLVKRLRRGDILIPSFQRNYVWKQAEASRFIESLLLGLPVPSVFLAKESESNKLLVIDGQQRLKTLQFFFDGYFNNKPFKLAKVQEEFEGASYDSLSEPDRIKLNDSIIHAIIVKQESPDKDNTSIYHIFDRLNSEGRRLTSQEIRTAVDHGDLIDLIKQLNEYPSWRKIYGKQSDRLKDQELILRFLSFYFELTRYEKPLEEFINKFSRKNRSPDPAFLQKAEEVFKRSIDIIFSSIGQSAFRPKRAINAAVFDSVMVSVARLSDSSPELDLGNLNSRYQNLISDDEYISLVAVSTSDERNVRERFEKTWNALGNLE